jgi:hypothetical protein
MQGGQHLMHQTPGAHYSEFVQPQNLAPMYHSPGAPLQSVSSRRSLASDTMSQDDTQYLSKASKEKILYRKAKSTNEKYLPIDPNARELILKCNKETSLAATLKILKGKIHLLIYNQAGSRFLQNLLKKANGDTIEFFLQEIQLNLYQLMMDKYGNYCCQELLQSCTDTQRLHILKKIQPNFIEI